MKILEAKIAREKDPDYFKKHSVLDLRPETAGSGILIEKQPLSPAQITEAIQHQLTERLQFVKPPDAAVASLLFDYAAIEAATGTLESAEKILRMAVNYGYPPEQVQPLIATYDHRIASRKVQQYGFYSLLALCGLGVLVLLYKKKILVLSSRDLLPRKQRARSLF